MTSIKTIKNPLVDKEPVEAFTKKTAFVLAKS
jgi:hypothetical protein